MLINHADWQGFNYPLVKSAHQLTFGPKKMTKCKLIKGLLGATALTAFSAGTAFAQNDFTTAGTTVSNTFTLNYEVNNTPQTQIDNIDNETEFNVDRLVNVTVTSLGDTFVVADQDDALLPFVVVNNGNDDHAYLLDIEQATGDEFDTTTATTSPDIFFFLAADDTNNDGVLSATERASGSPQNYNTAAGSVNIPVIAPDGRVFVFVRQNIPSGRVDTDVGGIVLFADTQTITGGSGVSLTFEETAADTDGNDANPLSVENVLADEDGPASAANDGLSDGAHSDRGDYIVENPVVNATKEVFGIAAANEGECDDIPALGSYTKPTGNTEYFTPNSCVEYVIEVRNEGTTDATNIDLSDILPANLSFIEAQVRGDFVLPTTAPVGELDVPSSTTVCDGLVTSACTIDLSNATLASGSAADPTIGYLVIRAVIN